MGGPGGLGRCALILIRGSGTGRRLPVLASLRYHTGAPRRARRILATAQASGMAEQRRPRCSPMARVHVDPIADLRDHSPTPPSGAQRSPFIPRLAVRHSVPRQRLLHTSPTTHATDRRRPRCRDLEPRHYTVTRPRLHRPTSHHPARSASSSSADAAAAPSPGRSTRATRPPRRPRSQHPRIDRPQPDA